MCNIYTTKPTIRLVWPAKTKFSLHIRVVWSESTDACAFYSLQAIESGMPYWVDVQADLSFLLLTEVLL